MPSNKSLFLMSLLSLTVTACQSTPATQTPTPSVSASPSVQPTPGASASPDGVTPTPGVTPVPTTPTPTPTPQPGAGSEGTVTLPNGSRLVVTLDNRFLSLVGQTSQLRTSLVDAAGQPLPLTGVTLNFVSSRPQDISVSATGLITALKENGFSQITANVVGTFLSTTLQVSVASGEGGGGGGGGGGGSSTPQPSASPTEDVDVDLGFEGLGLGEFQINTQTMGTQNDAVTAMSDDGSFVVAWAGAGEGGSDVFAQRFNSNGVPAGVEFLVNSQVSNYQGDPAIAINDNGDFVVVWESANQDGDTLNQANLYGQRYNSLGEAQGSEFRVNMATNDTQHRAAVDLNNAGEFVVSWASFQDVSAQDDVYAQRYDSMGNATGTEFRVNTATSGSQTDSAVALDDGGDFIVTWAQSEGGATSIQARRYLSSDDVNNPVNAEFQIASSIVSNGALENPEIAMDNDGDFVVSWNTYVFNMPYSNADVYARRYNAAGTAQGNAFQVNTYTTSFQGTADVAMDSNGDFVISWESVPQDGSTNGVYARRYNASGTSQGTPFRVNTTTSGSQSMPSVAMDSAGNFVIVWNSDGQDGYGSGVYAKRYAANGRVR